MFHVYEVVPDYVPSFEQARDVVAARQQRARELDEERGARALYDQDPARFAGGALVHLGRLEVPPPDILDVRLTRAEVERYHQEHMDRYSAPETVRARHILISPTAPGPEADEKARARATDLLRRIRAGEDFATLARQYSDDPPTRENGGDLGNFARGAMLEEFERAAFSTRGGSQRSRPDARGLYHPGISREARRRSRWCGCTGTWWPGPRAPEGTPDAGRQPLAVSDARELRAAARGVGLPIIDDPRVGTGGRNCHKVAVLARPESMKPGRCIGPAPF